MSQVHLFHLQSTTNTSIRLLHLARGKWKNIQQLLDLGINLKIQRAGSLQTSHGFAQV